MFFVFFRYWLKYNYCTFVVLLSILLHTYNTNYRYLFYVSTFSQFKNKGLPSQKAYQTGVFGSNLVKKIDIKQICYFTYTPKPNPHISPFPPSYSSILPPLPISHFFPTPPPCFPLYPTPTKWPLSHPFSPQISLPTLIFHTQISPSPLSIPPYPIILPISPSNSTPGFAPNYPKYVKTIPHSPLTAKTILDFSSKIVYNIRISTSKMLKYHHKINYFKGELSMSTELLQQIQPLIQSNPELKSQLVNYMTAYNIYIMSMGSIWVMIFYVLFLQFISNNNKQSQIKFLLTVNFVLLAIGLIAFLSIPYIAPDIYLFKLMN